MATNFPDTSPRGNFKIRRDHPRAFHGQGQLSRDHDSKNKITNKMKNTASRNAPGDVVSDDESQAGEEDVGVDASEDDEDEPDVTALSGVLSIGSRTASRLTGLVSDDVFNDDEPVALGATHDNDHDEDEDDYAAVADISDSEDSVVDEDHDEDSMLRIAEQDLIEEFERSEKPRNPAAVADRIDQMKITDDDRLTRRLSLQSEDSQRELDIDLDLSEDPFRGLSSHDDLYKEMVEDAEVAFDDALTRWRMPEVARSRENSVQSTSQKKVRFESTPSRASSMSSDEDPRDVYPDLFADIGDPLHRSRLVGNAIGRDAQDVESVYDFDFEDEFEKAANDFEAESDSEENMSRLESDDDGDTTDEETVDEQLARMREMKKAKGQSTDNIGVSAPATPVNNNGRKVAGSGRRAGAASRLETPKSSKKPRFGTFVHDPTRATVSADVRGSGVKLVCPTNPPEKDRAYWERARAAMSSRDGSPRESWTRTTPKAPSIPQRPLTAKSTLGTLFDGNLDFLRNHDVAGIAGDLLQHAGNDQARTPFTSATFTEDDATSDESNVNMADFVQLEESDSEMEDLVTTDVMSPEQNDFYSDFSLMSSPVPRQDSASAGLLDHLEQQRGLVTSFRTNQHRARHISSLASHPTKRAQTSESNALQAGRRNAANTPMTPARKQRGSQDLGVTGAGITKSNGSPMLSRHRRSRGSSLSGIHHTLALERFASMGSNQ